MKKTFTVQVDVPDGEEFEYELVFKVPNPDELCVGQGGGTTPSSGSKPQLVLTKRKPGTKPAEVKFQWNDPAHWWRAVNSVADVAGLPLPGEAGLGALAVDQTTLNHDKWIDKMMAMTPAWSPMGKDAIVMKHVLKGEPEVSSAAAVQTAIPWTTPSEIPMDALYRRRQYGAKANHSKPTCLQQDPTLAIVIDGMVLNMSRLAMEFEWSSDGGKTWKPCTKESLGVSVASPSIKPSEPPCRSVELKNGQRCASRSLQCDYLCYLSKAEALKKKEAELMTHVGNVPERRAGAATNYANFAAAVEKAQARIDKRLAKEAAAEAKAEAKANRKPWQIKRFILYPLVWAALIGSGYYAGKIGSVFDLLPAVERVYQWLPNGWAPQP